MKTTCFILASLGVTLHAANISLDLSKQKIGKSPKGFTAKVAGVGKAGVAVVREGEIPAAGGDGKAKGRLIEVTGGSTDPNHYTPIPVMKP